MLFKFLKRKRFLCELKLKAALSHRRNRDILRKELVDKDLTKWLDIGCSKTFIENFDYADILDEKEIPDSFRSRYKKIDITKPLEESLINLKGKYNLIRMQHVFEHFSPEDAQMVLKNCSELLTHNGYLLISVPDLRIFTRGYLSGALDAKWVFSDWARTRIDVNSPQSFYFSIYSHSVPHQQHLWCYDKEGIEFQLNKSGFFYDIREIKIWDKYFNFPFTHNRPLEDLVIICKKI